MPATTTAAVPERRGIANAPPLDSRQIVPWMSSLNVQHLFSYSTSCASSASERSFRARTHQTEGVAVAEVLELQQRVPAPALLRREVNTHARRRVAARRGAPAPRS